jgi:hypothetical protein
VNKSNLDYSEIALECRLAVALGDQCSLSEWTVYQNNQITSTSATLALCAITKSWRNWRFAYLAIECVDRTGQLDGVEDVIFRSLLLCRWKLPPLGWHPISSILVSEYNDQATDQDSPSCEISHLSNSRNGAMMRYYILWRWLGSFLHRAVRTLWNSAYLSWLKIMKYMLMYRKNQDS